MPANRPSQQARYWLLTIPHADWTQPEILPNGIVWLRGQRERGSDTGYIHWQLFAAFDKKVRLAGVKRIFGNTCHAEPSRSSAAEEYVFKEDTAIEGTRFELGQKKFNRNSAKDWEAIKLASKQGNLEDIPADVFVRNYRTLKAIEKDHMKPTAMERKVIVYWGPTGVGKSKKAWDLAGLDAYPKDPNTKFWDGYSGQSNVVIDEFRGKIDIAHILRWFDRYPVCVEQKFGACVFKATTIYVTSNLNPKDWYPELDEETKSALLRRLEIHHCPLNLF